MWAESNFHIHACTTKVRRDSVRNMNSVPGSFSAHCGYNLAFRVRLLAMMMASFLLLWKEGESLILSSLDIWLKLPSTVLFVLFVIMSLSNLGRLSGALEKIDRYVLPASASTVVTSMVLVLWLQNKYFGSLGYHLAPVYLGTATILGILVVLFSFALNGVTGNSDSIPNRNNLNKQFLFLGAVLALAAIVRIFSITSFPLNPLRSDMLPLIESASKTFLQGRNPYQIYHLTSGSLPLTYLPAMWLPFVPFAAFDIDPRWLSILGILGIAIVSSHAIKSRLDRWWMSVYCTLILNPYLILRHEIYTYFFWLLLCLSFYLLVSERFVLSSLFLGISLASQQTVLVVLPFYLLLVWRKVGVKALFVHLVLVGTVTLLLVLPFVVVSPAAFKYGVFDWFQLALDMPFSDAQKQLRGLTLATFFFALNLQRLLQPLQVVGILGGIAWSIQHLRTAVDFFAIVSVCYMLFILLNPVSSNYLFFPVILMMFFGEVARSSPQNVLEFGNLA